MDHDRYEWRSGRRLHHLHKRIAARWLVALLLMTGPLAACSGESSHSPEGVAKSHPALQRLPLARLRIMNYYPAGDGWSLMWSRYSHTQTVNDFKAIASLNANTVRVIVQPY